jgi:protein involved in polysaccharide export with SLBB domain
MKVSRIVMYLMSVFVIVNAGIIRNGDVLDIQVIDHPELSGRYEVDDQGKIDYPLIADEKITDISTTELTNDLTFKLARNIDNPLVLISIVEKPEIEITVLGEVLKPGVVKIIQGASIQEAIMNAGGPVIKSADLTNIKVIHKNRPDAPEIFDFQQFLKDGDVEKMPQLAAEDIVIVTTKNENKNVKVIGAVQKPGIFELTDTLNIFEIIYMAGGPVEKADFSRIRRLSVNSGNKADEEIIDLQSYIDQGKMDKIPKVNPGDVIIVYSKWFDWKTMLAVLNNTLLIIVTIQAFAGVFK